MKNSSHKKEKKNITSYQILLKSNLAISTMTTMLRENLSINNKILSCNFTQNKIYDFPINGISTINKICNYRYFEKRANLLLKMPRKKYLDKMRNRGKYLVNYNKEFSSIKLITNKLDNLLKI
jgi:hypothetical protein